MTRFHIVVENSNGDVVKQFDIKSDERRLNVLENIPDDCSIAQDRQIPSDMDLQNSLADLSANEVIHDPRFDDIWR